MKIDKRRWLTDSAYRKERSLVHPAQFFWACLVCPFTIVALLLYCALLTIQCASYSRAKAIWSRKR
jgi:hypothetical protein